MFVYIRLSGLVCAALVAAGPVGRRDDDTRPAVYHFDNIPVETGNFLPTNPAQLNYIDGLYFRGLRKSLIDMRRKSGIDIMMLTPCSRRLLANKQSDPIPG